jgi:hypothetical protein
MARNCHGSEITPKSHAPRSEGFRRLRLLVPKPFDGAAEPIIIVMQGEQVLNMPIIAAASSGRKMHFSIQAILENVCTATATETTGSVASA